MKHFFVFSVIMLLVFVSVSCNNSEITPSVEVVSLTEQIPETPKRASLSLSAEVVTSRSALPSSLLDSIGRFALYVNDSNLGLNPDNKGIIGLWDSYESMCDATMDVEIGTWTFTLSALSNQVSYISQKTVTLVAGSNPLHFVLGECIRENDHGYGDLCVKLKYDKNEQIGLITCGLYNTDEQVILGSGNIALQKQDSGTVEYTQTKIPSGDYIVIFKIYADEERRLLRSTFREYACIFAGKVSSSECEITSLAKVYRINYELGGGTFVSEYTPNTQYTRLGTNILLPDEDKVTREGYVFYGWYDNPQYEGKSLSFIPSGSWGDKTVYAKWQKELTITFDANGGVFGNDSETVTQTVIADETTDLLSSADLRLRSKNEKRFLRWNTVNDDAGQDYEDGEQIKVTHNLYLYAVWSLSTVNVHSGDDKDTDGDGLSDYDELYKFYTDPTNKDTDGDGWTDYEELHGLYNPQYNIFNPHIADVPKIEMVIVGNPVIEYKYTKTDSSKDTKSQTLSEGTVVSRSTTESFGITESNNHSHGVGVGISPEHSIGIAAPGAPAAPVQEVEMQDIVAPQNDGGGGEGGDGEQGDNNPIEEWENVHREDVENPPKGTNDGTKGYKSQIGGGASSKNSFSYIHSDSYTFSSSETQSFSKSISNGKTTSLTKSQTWIGGSFKISVKFKNPGNIAYSVDKMNIVVTRTPNNSSYYEDAVGGIVLSSVGTIMPGGETGEFVLEKDLTVAETEELLKWSNAINVRISGYTIKIHRNMASIPSNDFTGVLTRVWNKCALVNIDYGPNSTLKTESYLVSTKYKYNPDAVSADDLYTNPNLREVLEDLLGITQASGSLVLKSDGRIQSIRGVSNLDGPNLVNNGKVIQGSWYITHKYTNDNNKIMIRTYQMAYNISESVEAAKLENIRVGQSDEINIFYSVDRDGDGLPKRSELLHGTSDDNSDTDGDGISDFDEIFGWYNKDGQHPNINSEKYNADHKCYSNPNNPDTDGDGIPDNEDPDPIIVKKSSNAEIKTAKYKKSAEGSISGFSFSDTTAYLNDLNEYIFLDIEPEETFSTVGYRMSDKDKWKVLDSTKQIELKIGENKIYIMVVAPDNKTTKEYVVNVSSDLRWMTNYTLFAPELSGGNVIIDWDPYVDCRMDNTNDSNDYVLVIQQNRVDMSQTEYYPTRTEALQAVEYKKNAKFGDQRTIVNMTSADIKNGAASLMLKPDTDYTIGLFACFNTNNSNTYNAKVMRWKRIKTEKERYGTLTFYASHMYDKLDLDGSKESEFYWDITSNMFTSGSNNISSLSKTTSQYVSMDDDNQAKKRYCFDCERTHSNTGYDHAKKYTIQIDRKDGYSNGYVNIHFYEHDSGADPDDDLDSVKLWFSYSKSADKVYCEWYDWQWGNGASKWNFESAGYKAGKTNCTAYNYDKDDGYIEFRFSFSWE